MNYRPIFNAGIIVVFICALCGCATDNGARMGRSVNLIMAQQTLNPQAALNSDPVTGMDGKAAKSAYDAYQKSFRSPEPKPNVFTIGVGGGR